MRMNVLDAENFAAALQASAQAAKVAGQSDFDLLDALNVVDDQARQQLAQAIAEAHSAAD